VRLIKWVGWGEDVLESGEGVDVNALAESHEAAQHCVCPSASITSEKL
jgi:hypothetical protein